MVVRSRNKEDNRMAQDAAAAAAARSFHDKDCSAPK